MKLGLTLTHATLHMGCAKSAIIPETLVNLG